MEAHLDRVGELHVRLIDERDDRNRASMHLELATLALKDGKLDQAARHFREALVFDATLDRARRGLEDLGDLSRGRGDEGRRGFFRGLIDRLRRR
jgi:hypothetical protein